MSCDPSLSDEIYDDMIKEPSTDPWFCDMCFKLTPINASNTIDPHPGQLSCACLNARSVLLKRFDIFAFVCAHHIDILAITEMTLLVMGRFQENIRYFVVTAHVMEWELLL